MFSSRAGHLDSDLSGSQGPVPLTGSIGTCGLLSGVSVGASSNTGVGVSITSVDCSTGAIVGPSIGGSVGSPAGVSVAVGSTTGAFGPGESVESK
jgi:hypothetical protein